VEGPPGKRSRTDKAASIVGVEGVVWLQASSLAGWGVNLLISGRDEEAGEVGVHGRDGKEIGRDYRSHPPPQAACGVPQATGFASHP